ncbi:MAG: tRNA lysidine(34) synthetase TilS [Lachnospiraceae bacterium]|nr:tRNA lysidine(34) synthetase TilS [Lachnospiraceae bacterium]
MRRIFDVIEAYHMIEPGMHVIAGVSGGADSVCLLYVLNEYRRKVPFMLTAVHVEHGLRGEESLEDAQFTSRLCGEMGLPFRLAHACVKQLAGEKGMSIEEAGRVERYRIFEEIRKELGAQKIAVAHNRNDQAETVLHHLVRGSGLKGLGGICPVRGAIIRPLLFTERREIEEILVKANVPWRVDRTNLEQEYTRNKIRLSILPQMERELNERAVEHIAQAAERLQQVQSYLEQVTDRAAQKCIFIPGESGKTVLPAEREFRNRQTDRGSVCILLPSFFEEDDLIRQELIRRALAMCGGLRDVGAVHVNALMKLAEMDCGRELSLPGGIRAVRENQMIRFARQSRPEHAEQEVLVLEEPGHYWTEDWEITVELMENSEVLYTQIIAEKKYTKWFSYDTIKSNVLFRTRRTGDYLVVNAQGGRKKLKDYLIDCKIPKDRRDQIWLLAEGSHVLWVPGYRISEAAKVTKTTKKVMKIQLEERSK